MAERTGKTTVRGKPVYLDENTGEEYSEKLSSFDYGDGYLVTPTINPETGDPYDLVSLMDYYRENGPYEPFTGEKLPVHMSMDEADRYAQWRSDNQFNEDIFSDVYWHRDAAMPYYSDSELDVYRPTFRDNARNNIRDGLMGLGMSEGVSQKVAKGLAGEENPTDGGMGMGLLDFTPLGIPMGVQEARRDFNRASENDDLVGQGAALTSGALSLAGALPAVGVAAKGIKRTADKMIDAYDPSAVGSFGGNLFAPKKTSNMSVLTKDADTDALQTLGLDEATREEWRGFNKVNQRQQRIPQIQDAATALKNGEITSAEYRELVESFQPIVPLNSVPPLPTLEEIASALNSDKVRKGIIGVNKGVEDGTYVASRLDIPAYEQYDTWVVSLHDGANGKLNGASIGYAQTAVLNDVTFGTVPKAAVNIASGKDKTTIARIFGNWENKNPEEVHALAQKYMNDPEWTQVGMNPFRHSYFYDKATGEPVVEAAEVIQVGPLVLARDVKRASADDAMFRINPRDKKSPTFALGGLATARKGITTEEGMEMAKKGFQLDDKKADLDKDGELSTYERTRGEAVQRAMDNDEVVEMAHGGMACTCGYGGECGCGEGMMGPIGTTRAETMDDIEVMISEGEYVLPANVVRWHGLKHIMDMQDEAEAGLMMMHSMGLIQEVDPNEEGEEAEPDGEDIEDAEVQAADRAAEDEETYETPEGTEIELADGMDVEEEDLDIEEMETPYAKPFGSVTQRKVAIMAY